MNEPTFYESSEAAAELATLEKINKASKLLNNSRWFANFMGRTQRQALLESLRGEEAEGIADLVINVAARIEGTPVTYNTEDVKSEDKVLHLHYYKGGIDAWIVERDVGDESSGDGKGVQRQAYGKITVFNDGFNGAEWGYVSIEDLIKNGVSLDLYWTPRTCKEMK